MRWFWVGGCVLAAVAATPCVAADAVANWSGLYVGAHTGFASSRYHIFDSTVGPPGETATFNKSSWLAGAQIGYNWQLFPHWLIGTEIDISGTHLGTTGVTDQNAFPATSHLDRFGTVRTRIGYADNRYFVYATGGLAWARDAFAYTVAGLVQMDDHQYHLGWTGGLGFEYALDPHWSARIEYLHADFGRDTAIYTGAPRFTEVTADMVRVGVDYRLGGGAAVVASLMPVKARVTVPAMSERWSGTYLGAHAAWARGPFTLNDQLTPNFVAVDPAGWLGGFQGGYNWQLSRLVIGVETDLSFGSLNRTNINPGNLVAPVFAEATNVRVDRFGTARARAGVACDRVLLYGTGGLAWARADFAETSVNGIDAARREYRVGWAGGAGLEVAIDRRWSAKLEYLHTDFGTAHATVFDVTLPVDYSLRLDTVRAGVNYRFAD